MLKVTIANTLELKDLASYKDMNGVAVLDLRFSKEGQCRPIEESVLKQLQKYFVTYGQLPLDLSRKDRDFGSFLHRRLAMFKDEILVLTDQGEEMAEFCKALSIPCCHDGDSEIVIPEPAYIPVNEVEVHGHQAAYA